MERDPKAKSHLWVPTKNHPENFNYHTFNDFAEIYHQEKNTFNPHPERKNLSHTFWGRKHDKDREKFLMKYDDAK